MWKLTLLLMLCCVHAKKSGVTLTTHNFNYGGYLNNIVTIKSVQRIGSTLTTHNYNYSGDLNKCTNLPLTIGVPSAEFDSQKTIVWPPNLTLVVYDAHDCGGNNMVLYPSGLYKKAQGEGTTDADVPLTGELNLHELCKFTSCGYSSTAYTAVFLNSGQVPASTATSPDQCKCEEIWGDSVRSFQIMIMRRLRVVEAKEELRQSGISFT